MNHTQALASHDEHSELTEPGATGGRLRRRIDRFRRAGLLATTNAFTVEQAITEDELRQAYALVHDVFVEQKYILPQRGGLRLRPFEALPEMATFVAKADGRVVAVMSVIADSPELGLPSDRVFKVELDMLRLRGRRICETTNLAVHPDYRNTAVFFELSRCCIAYGLNQGFDDSFVSISPGHAMFFETVMGFEPWGDRRNYSDSTVDLVEGLRLDLRQFESKMVGADRNLGEGAFLHDWFFRDNPFFDYTRASMLIGRQKFLDPKVLVRLFIEETSAANRWTDAVLDVLRSRWGERVFNSVIHQLEEAPATRAFAA